MKIGSELWYWTEFMSQQRVGFLDEGQLVLVVDGGGPKFGKLGQHLIGLFLPILGYCAQVLLHLLHCFGGVFGEIVESLGVGDECRAEQYGE